LIFVLVTARTNRYLICDSCTLHPNRRKSCIILSYQKIDALELSKGPLLNREVNNSTKKQVLPEIPINLGPRDAQHRANLSYVQALQPSYRLDQLQI